MKENKLSVLIPCFNEEKTIAKVISDFKAELPNAIIYVCDNNSTDNTAKVALENGAVVFKEYMQGKGNAVLRMLREVESDLYILVDGDDTYPANSATAMIAELQEYHVGMVVGDRLSNGTYKQENKRMFHNFGNNLIKRLINNFFNSNLADILSGYRVFSRSFVKNYSTLAKGFELETDLSLFALHYNLGIREVPIDYKDRPEGSQSKLNTYKDGMKIILTFFNLYRFYKPLSFFSYLGGFILLISLILGSLPVYEFLTTGFIKRIPTAILASGLGIVSLLFFGCGIILDTIMRIDNKDTQLRIRNSR